MVKLTKIYTKTGDGGETHLAGGLRTAKTDVRIACIGDIDELNSWFGMIIVKLNTELGDLHNQCIRIQQTLFNLGAELAIVPEKKRDDSPHITTNDTSLLEQQIDEMNDSLAPLNSFILPGGNDLSATLHITRSVCRRAERQLFELNNESPLSHELLIYVNRLSDWLFVAARFVCHKTAVAETLWLPN